MVLAIVLGLIMWIGHYFSEGFSARCGKYKPEIISLSAGISITYIFLDLFPRFSEGAIVLNRMLFLTVLVGFAFLHLVEKYIYYHVPKSRLRKDLALEDSAMSFVYHFVVGVLIYAFISQGIGKGLLLFIPVMLYTALSTLPVTPPRHKGMRVILSASTLLGVLFAGISRIADPLILNSLLGFVIGILLFTVIRHSLPFGKRGQPAFFILGTIGYSLVIVLTWVI